MATDLSAKFIGDLTLNMLQNKISRAATGLENPILDARIPKAAGLEGVSDPYERIYSALSSHIEKYGMNDNLTRQFESLTRNVADDPSLLSKYHVKQALSAYRQGISMHEASLKSATRSVPEKPVDEAPPSKLRRNINRSQALSSSRSCASRSSKIKIKGWQNWF